MNTIAKKETGAISPGFAEKMKYMSREELLTAASDAIQYLHGRTCAGRQFKESATDKTRAAYLRVLIQAVTAYTGLLRDEELLDLEGRIAALEQLRGGGKV